MNFNPMMATAGKVTIAEVEELVDRRARPRRDRHARHLRALVVAPRYEKRIERRTVRKG
jgi:3-oxoacid CoA-transferase subunit A